MISCREASILGLKKEEKPLSFKDSLQLRMHLMMCKFCSAFQKQSDWITQALRNLTSDDQLSPEEKARMQERLADRMSTNNPG